jgi:hypothetical protein
MPIPTPEPGLVISYAYVWDDEAQGGQEEGRKNRPCVIAIAVERQLGSETLVTVLPVTHRPPDIAAQAVEIPRAVKQHLGLDDDRSRVVVTEGDQFVSPGYDLPRVRRSDRYDYGVVQQQAGQPAHHPHVMALSRRPWVNRLDLNRYVQTNPPAGDTVRKTRCHPCSPDDPDRHNITNP